MQPEGDSTQEVIWRCGWAEASGSHMLSSQAAVPSGEGWCDDKQVLQNGMLQTKQPTAPRGTHAQARDSSWRPELCANTQRFPGSSKCTCPRNSLADSGGDPSLSLQGAWVQSLVRERRSHKPHGSGKKVCSEIFMQRGQYNYEIRTGERVLTHKPPLWLRS